MSRGNSANRCSEKAILLSASARGVLNIAPEKYRPGQSEPILVGGNNLLKAALQLMTFYRLVIEEIKDAEVITSYTRWVDAVQVRGAENQEVYLTFNPVRIWLPGTSFTQPKGGSDAVLGECSHQSDQLLRVELQVTHGMRALREGAPDGDLNIFCSIAWQISSDRSIPILEQKLVATP